MTVAFGDKDAIALARRGFLAGQISECQDCNARGEITEECPECEGEKDEGHCDTCTCGCDECGGAGVITTRCEHPKLNQLTTTP